MILKNEALKGQKLGIGKSEIIEVDAQGCVTVTEKPVIEALLASGFHEVQQAPKKEKSAEKPVAVEEEKEEIKKEEVVEDKKDNRRWKRN